jgi:hypothetical protein
VRHRAVGGDREVVQGTPRREQGDHPVRCLRGDAEVAGGGQDLGQIAAAVQEPEQHRCPAHSRQGDSPAGVDADLDRVPVAPDGDQAGLEGGSHALNRHPAL